MNVTDIDVVFFFFFFQAEDGIRDLTVTGVQTCALPILCRTPRRRRSTTTVKPLPTSSRARTVEAPAQLWNRHWRAFASSSRARSSPGPDRKSVVEGKSVDLGGRRIIKKKKKKEMRMTAL